MSDTIPAIGLARLHGVESLSAQRILVVATQTATSPQLTSALLQRARVGPVAFHLVVPALNSRLRHWLSDTDEAVLTAHVRARRAREALRSHGLEVSTEVGDSVPLLAIEDALAQFEADEIVIFTLASDRSHWLEHDIVQSARDRFGMPVRHVLASAGVSAAA